VIDTGFARLGCPVRYGVPLSELTTMGVGGPCRVYIEPRSAEDVRAAVALCRERGMKWIALGNGSNVLAGDAGFDGPAPHLARGLRGFALADGELRADAGASLPKLSLAMAEEGVEGFEFMAGIPGTVGGAVVMNAGCLGRETEQVLRSVTYLDESGELVTEPAERLALGFRSSAFQGRRAVIVSAVFEARRADPEAVRERTREAAAIRRRKFPVNVATVGSTFKSPPQGPHPGRLIEEAGLKGTRIGGAVISEVHANWIVNTGGATAADVRRLIELMRETVARKLGVEMEPEVLFI